MQPQRTRGFYQTLRRRTIANWRIGMAIGIGIILSLTSGYRTWDGMIAFMAPDPTQRGWAPLILALFVTVSIQTVMLLAAWRVGTALVQAAEPHRRLYSRARVFGDAGVWMIMFLSTLCAAVFFSYHSFYTAIAGYYAREVAPSTEIVGNQQPDEAVSNAQARGNRSLHMNSLAEIHVRRTVAASLTEMQNEAEAQRAVYFEALTRPRPQLSAVAQKMLEDRPSLGAANQAWQDYKQRMNDIVTFSQSTLPDIERQTKETLAAERKEQADRARDEESRRIALDDATKDLNRITESLTSVTAQIATLKNEIAELETQIQEQVQKENNANFRMQCELGGNECPSGNRAKAGVGPRYKQAASDVEDAKLRQDQFKELRQQAENRLSELERRRNELDQSSGPLRQSIASIRGASGASTANMTAEPAPAPSLLPPADLAATIDAMVDALAHLTSPVEFGEPDSAATAATAAAPGTNTADAFQTAATGANKPPALAVLEASCERLLANFSDEVFGDVAKKARQYSCAQEGVGTAIARVQELNAGLRAFSDQECQTLGRAFREANTAKIIRRGDECLETVALDGARADGFMLTFAELRREHNETVHPFVQSYNGIAVYDDKLAYLSLGIAIMIDVMVFFIGIVGGNESLRRIDRIGQELRGDDILSLAVAASSKSRPTDSESIDLSRRILNQLVPEDYVPDPNNARHIRYSGYILDSDLQSGDEEDERIRRQIQVWMSTPKSDVDLVLRYPRPENDEPVAGDGTRDSADLDDEPVRYFFLRELVIDLAEDIVNWDKAYASARSESVGVTPPRPTQPRSQESKAPPRTDERANLRWRWTRSGGSESNPVGAQTAGDGDDNVTRFTIRPAQTTTEPGE